MRLLSRCGLGEQPTTAQVPGAESRSRIVASEFRDAMAARLADASDRPPLKPVRSLL
jgi:hypothetical protein